MILIFDNQFCILSLDGIKSSGVINYMRKILVVFSFLFFSKKIFGQQFSQYNTGTLYGSFENPSQGAFIPDSSRKYAFNFFAPNLSTGFFLNGDAQATLKTRYFLGMYNNTLLKINQSSYNHVNAGANLYWFMAKLFASLDGDEEIGISAQTKSEGRGLISDATFALFNGTSSFEDGALYSNVFNSSYYVKTYHQFSFTYREKLSKQFAFGIKLSGLLGIQYTNLNISSSSGTVSYLNQSAFINLQGKLQQSYIPGNFTAHTFFSVLRNPGAAITIGTTYKTADGFIIQGNVKDIGFINWGRHLSTYNFNASGLIQGLATPTREDSVFNAIKKIDHTNATQGAVTTVIDGKAELSISKRFWLTDDKTLKYSPTFVASQELFYNGFVAALVNPVQIDNYSVALTTAYSNLTKFTLGAQFMIKTPNLEFFVGTDQLAQTATLLSNSIKSPAQFNQNPSLTGANFFIGFSAKFGPVIEHPMNASYIPIPKEDEKGFIGRLIERIFGKRTE